MPARGTSSSMGDDARPPVPPQSVQPRLPARQGEVRWARTSGTAGDPVRDLYPAGHGRRAWIPALVGSAIVVLALSSCNSGSGETTVAVAQARVAAKEADLAAATAVLAYPASGNALLSGWLLGPQKLNGKAAMVDVKRGRGHVVLYGFRPQYRGQSNATFPLIWAAIGKPAA